MSCGHNNVNVCVTLIKFKCPGGPIYLSCCDGITFKYLTDIRWLAPTQRAFGTAPGERRLRNMSLMTSDLKHYSPVNTILI